tara:strand:+ start:8492 stop:9541 length:1050 start_codon:yes stop_codon:yes gene_type:complete
MKKINLSAKKKIHSFFNKKIKNFKIKKIYFEFKKNIERHNFKRFSVAISGGSDSMALAFFAKYYSIVKKINVFYYIVDHRLRKESTNEAKIIKAKLKKYGIVCKILSWKGKKASSNIQSKARDKRYKLIFNECLKKKVNFILTGHQKDDLYENFFIRLLRGSGLKGLSSFNNSKSKVNKSNNIYILRPLLNFSKKDLIYVTKNTFNFFVEDPTNYNDYFLRIKIRKLLNVLNNEGLNLNNFKLTLENLYKSNTTIDFYVSENIRKNSKFLIKKNSIIVNENFFNHPDEIIFRSFSELLHKVGRRVNYTRGSKISNMIKNLKQPQNFKKMTLSGCILEKVNKSIIISKEI